MKTKLATLKQLSSLVDFVWPERCCACGRLHRTGLRGDARFFCDSCRDTLLLIESCCPRCGFPYEPGTTSHLCGYCLDAPPGFEQLVALYEYGGAISQAILRFKFGRNPALARPLGTLLVHGASFLEGYDVVVPIPIHRERLRLRGFNQAALLAAPVSRRLGCPWDPTLLIRVGAATSQARLGREERLRSIKGAFALRAGAHIENKRFLIVDDVATTCATVGEAASVLLNAGAQKVSVLTLARAG